MVTGYISEALFNRYSRRSPHRAAALLTGCALRSSGLSLLDQEGAFNAVISQANVRRTQPRCRACVRVSAG
jgi:hypothetical protein